MCECTVLLASVSGLLSDRGLSHIRGVPKRRDLTQQDGTNPTLAPQIWTVCNDNDLWIDSQAIKHFRSLESRMEDTLSKIPKQYRDDNIRKFQPNLEDQISNQLPDTLYGALNENQTWTSLRPSYEPIDVDSGMFLVVSIWLSRYWFCSGFKLCRQIWWKGCRYKDCTSFLKKDFVECRRTPSCMALGLKILIF